MQVVEFFVRRGGDYTQARRHRRLPVDLPVHFDTGRLRVGDRARDVSESGLGVATPEPLPPMSLVRVELELPQASPVGVLARVMWAREGAMGLRFEQSDERLTDFVERQRGDFSRI